MGKTRTPRAHTSLPESQEASSTPTSNDGEMSSASDKPKRLTLSRVVEAQLAALMNRGGRGSSSVTLTRNARGATQIEVSVHVGEAGIDEPDDAAEVAK